MVSAVVSAGIGAGYLVHSRLAKVDWQAAGRPAAKTRGDHYELMASTVA